MLETAMRPLFSYLKATVAPSGVFAATDDFGTDANLTPRVAKAATEFAQLVLWTLGAAATAGQAPAAAYKAPGLEALTVTPFEELLKRNTPGA